MAVDKLVDSTQLNTDLTAVANAIRTKGGTSASLAFPADFVSAIAAIPTGGGGSGIKEGTFTPAERTATVTIDTGDPSFSSINGFVAVPKSASPWAGVGKCLGGFFSFPSLFYKSYQVRSGSGGTGATVAPGLSTTGSMVSAANGVITINSAFGYVFEPIEWAWFAW